MRVGFDGLSQFAFSMVTCLSSGLPPRKALELSGATVQCRALREAVARAGAACDQGLPISDGFESSRRIFPHFFLPVIRAGEQAGRLVEAFQLIQDHCHRLKPSLVVIRNTWLYPLICILVGWTVRTAIFLYFGMYSLAGLFVRDTFVMSAMVVLAGWTVLKIRPVRTSVDWLLLQLPLVRETLLHLSAVLFFSTFRLAYEAAGLAVTTMLDLALHTVGNSAVRRDLAKARPVLEDHGSFEDAFDRPALLDDHIKSSIAAGAMSGHLGTSLRQIVQAETLALETKLEVFNRVFQRLLAYSVAMSVVGTLLFCLSYSR